MNQITAPYGFVPLAGKVFFPSWLHGAKGLAPLHDVPFQDGLCGHFTLEIETETPIFVRGTDSSGKEPFQLSDGRYAIPGTALRGSLRNIIEIVSFSRFQRVNDHRYAVRDLNNPQLYGSHMAEIMRNPRTNKGEPMPLVNAGWLSRKYQDDTEIYEIEVCDFAKFEYRELMNLAQQRGVRGFEPGRKQSSAKKYETWGKASREVTVKVDFRRPTGPRLLSDFGVASLQGGNRKGTLVMTGQPSRWTPDPVGKRAGAGNAKHHDFVFLEKSRPETRKVPEHVFRDFEFGHSNRGQQNRLGESQTPNEEWAYWKEVLERDQRVPVFFLADQGGQIASFGLAMMFRLPYKHSIHQAIENCSSEHFRPGRLDFAEGLFGTAPQGREQGFALKGRVGISHAFAEGQPRPGQEVKAILGAPKASYYPNYVEQDPSCPGSQPALGRNNRANYKTWMDSDGIPRGWKRYRALKDTYHPDPPTGADGRPLDASKVGTVFKPLPKGTRFRAHVDIHNLRPEELGALLWAISWGGDPQARHTLGMARPLGYGRSQMRIVESDLYGMDGSKPDLDRCLQAFETMMSKEVPGWKASPQIRELLELAKPVSVNQARYQRLDPGKKVNEFVDAKRAGLALPSTVQHPRQAQQPRQAVSAGTRPMAGGGGPRPSPVSSASLATGSLVEATMLEKQTKKGGAMFEVGGKEAILHPSSTPPPDMKPGATYTFTVMSTGVPLSLKYVDPNAPPPPPPKRTGPGPNRPGGHRR